MTHTPGPWRVEEGTTLIWGNCDPDDFSSRGFGYSIAECHISNRGARWTDLPKRSEGEANARLIAAAPDLLATLENLITWRRGNENVPPHHCDDVWLWADEVIAKAKGELQWSQMTTFLTSA